MSQIIKNPPAGSIPSDVLTEFKTDLNDPTVPAASTALGTVVPQSHVVRIAGDNGIKTVETSEPGDLQLRFIRGSNQTVGATTETLITQPTLTDSTATFQIIVAGFSTDDLAVGAYGTAVIKNVAGTVSVVNTVDLIVNKDTGLDAANITVTISGTDILINAVGVTAKTIDWTACLPGFVVSS